MDTLGTTRLMQNLWQININQAKHIGSVNQCTSKCHYYHVLVNKYKWRSFVSNVNEQILHRIIRHILYQQMGHIWLILHFTFLFSSEASVHINNFFYDGPVHILPYEPQCHALFAIYMIVRLIWCYVALHPHYILYSSLLDFLSQPPLIRPDCRYNEMGKYY